jgi:hypothetical protein
MISSQGDRMKKVLNTDDIAMLQDEELLQRHHSLVSYIERDRRRGNHHPDLEVDACYFARELEVREARRRNHAIYLEKIGVRLYEG